MCRWRWWILTVLRRAGMCRILCVCVCARVSIVFFQACNVYGVVADNSVERRGINNKKKVSQKLGKDIIVECVCALENTRDLMPIISHMADHTIYSELGQFATYVCLDEAIYHIYVIIIQDIYGAECNVR